jgi:hypothetical protein
MVNLIAVCINQDGSFETVEFGASYKLDKREDIPNHADIPMLVKIFNENGLNVIDITDIFQNGLRVYTDGTYDG